MNAGNHLELVSMGVKVTFSGGEPLRMKLPAMDRDKVLDLAATKVW